MITDQYRQINTINGVAAGGKATVTLPLNSRIKELFLVYKDTAAEATMEADLGPIVLNINGQPRRNPTVAQIFIIEKHEGRDITPGIVPIRFRNPSASDDQWEDRSSLNTFRLASATLVIPISADAVNPTLEVYANYDGIDDKNDFLCVWDTVSFGNQGAGTKTKTDLEQVGILQRIDFFGTDNLPVSVKVRADRNDIIELIPSVRDRWSADYGYATQANHFAVLLTNTRRPQEGLYLDALATGYEVSITTEAAGDVDAIVQRLVNKF